MGNAVTAVAKKASTRKSAPRSLWAREQLDRFETYLASRDDLSQRTRETYCERVTDLLRWLETRADRQEALDNPAARDRVALAYHDHLITERRVLPSTVNLARAAINTFYQWRGVGPTTLARIKHPPRTTRTLAADQQSALLRAAAARSHRDHAIIGLLLNNGLSLSEVRLVDVDGLALRAESGHLEVCGLSGTTRTVVLAASTRRLLELWLAERRTMLGALRPRALFISERRRRISSSSIDRIVRSIGREAGLELSPGTLRYTFDTRMLESGIEPWIVAQTMGLTRPNPQRLHTLQLPLEPRLARKIAEAMAVSDTAPPGRNQHPADTAPTNDQLAFDL
ncbi:tyrosine-type recombinase/integrase [Nocardia abscessus]|uniref:tyrosine-type recombinase/integrase n=1 Tax=Nocardia abscessus TaxID=120957 RepID=UPI0018932B7A|nr:tyrosine-type recombinase/integrase [Nocardia abscessus]MBF6340876.1 tyrosine-type recombinase/integrase [Nocardia abscessus]